MSEDITVLTDAGDDLRTCRHSYTVNSNNLIILCVTAVRDCPSV